MLQGLVFILFLGEEALVHQLVVRHLARLIDIGVVQTQSTAVFTLKEKLIIFDVLQVQLRLLSLLHLKRFCMKTSWLAG